MTPLESLVAFLASSAVFIAWFGRQTWLHKPLIESIHFVKNRLPGARNHQMLQTLMNEYRPDGGSSLRDSLDRLEKKLIETHKHTKLILKMQRITDENMGIATVTADKNGKCTYANTHYQTLVGLRENELLGDGWKNVMSQDERQRISEHWNAAVQERRDYHDVIAFTNNITGAVVPGRVDAYLIEDEGEVVGWVAYVQPMIGRRKEDPNVFDPAIEPG